MISIIYDTNLLKDFTGIVLFCTKNSDNKKHLLYILDVLDKQYKLDIYIVYMENIVKNHVDLSNFKQVPCVEFHRNGELIKSMINNIKIKDYENVLNILGW